MKERENFVFFSMNDFVKEGGGTIRMLGIMNELAIKNESVVFISNASDSTLDLFHPKIEHIYINHLFSRKDKRIFQGLLSILPIFLINNQYQELFKKLKKIFSEQISAEEVYFFEYLDNSIGYWLKKNNIIKKYINDLHGVATLEFKFQADLAKSIKEKALFVTKYRLSNLLDRKVFENANGFIFASQAMENFYKSQYPSVALKNNKILPYLLSSSACKEKSIDNDLISSLKENYSIKPDEKIILFAGAFKKTGGVPDLIAAFSKSNEKYPLSRLFLIGDGPTMQECLNLVEKLQLQEKIIFIGRTPYHELSSYQELSDIIVCPDKQNIYSELIIHVKYLDALISNKVVINGSFKSVQEINENERLSLSFQPSDIQSLSVTLNKALNDLENLSEKYKNNNEFVCKNLTYAANINALR